MNSYDKGDLVRLTAAFTNIGGTATDPSTVVCRVENPNGAVTSYTYGTADPTIIRAGTGSYYMEVVPTISGEWFYRWEGTGAVQQADEDAFFVEASKF